LSKGLAKKLGLLPGQLVGLVDAPVESAALILANCPVGVTFLENIRDHPSNLLFFLAAADERIDSALALAPAQHSSRWGNLGDYPQEEICQ
jgi:hypothetical protein